MTTSRGRKTKKTEDQVQEITLEQVVEATNAGSFLYTAPEFHQPLVEAGLVEVNLELTEDGKFATRAIIKTQEPVQETIQETTETQMTETTQETVQSAAFVVASEAIPMPAVKRGGGGRTESYPFSTLAEGQSFFVPSTEGKPDPAKALASTVCGANRRYSEAVPGEFRTNRKGNEVAVTSQTRKFELRQVADGAAWGYPGVSGAGVWRTL